MDEQQHLLGRMAVEYGLVTEDQLQLALAVQRRAQPHPSLGDVLVQERLLSRPVVDRLLGAQRRLRGLHGDAPGLSADEIARRIAGADIGELLRLQRELGAMELHLVSGAPPFVRANGSLIDLSPQPLEPEACRRLLTPVLGPSQREALDRDRSLVAAVERDGARFRASLFHQARGLTGVFRLIADAPPALDTLGLPDTVERIPQLHQGLVLVTGPRGSGKTTTLAALIARMNAGRRRHIVTIEQPIEYVFESDHCLISQREVGVDVADYATALRSSLREDPDVIVVSELGEPERVATALTAAETGHLVLGTLHSPNAYRTILRVLDAYTGRQRSMVRGMLAAMLRMVVSQQLLPDVHHRRLHLAAEVLTVNHAVAAMIREDRVHQIPQVMRTGREEGMQLMDDALIALVREGKVAFEEALDRAEEPDELRRAVEVTS